jgi:biotin-[acetyl-CoA-carboxylase] ligase BirA-like protein
MSQPASIEQWPVRLEQVLASDCTMLKRITVLQQTDSTQDAARQLAARPGDVITAWRQISGRGRLGRAWADTGADGVAVTLVAHRVASELLAIASAVGVALAIEGVLGKAAGIKWPNDIVVNGRKLSGILIEQTEQLALIGIGINVSQRQWPVELDTRAISLAQLGASVDRLDVLAALLPAMDQALRWSAERVEVEFAKRDAMVGTVATFRCGQRTVTGRVARIDPLRGLEIHCIDAGGDNGKAEYLPAATTSLVDAHDQTKAGANPAM